MRPAPARHPARLRPPLTPRRRRHRGFIILFGARTIVSNDSSGAPPVHTACPNCGREVGMLAKAHRTWFTLFFLPIFPVSGKTRFTECPSCGSQFAVAPEQLRAQLGAADAASNQRAIAMYNSQRASPANAVTLHQLMETYAQMREYDQAIAAAGQFPDALSSSEQCMVMLARVYMAKNDYATAIQWLDGAIARNPYDGEAHYYRAIAHLLKTPPDAGQAVVSARAARGAGHPGADEVLRDAEARLRG